MSRKVTVSYSKLKILHRTDLVSGKACLQDPWLFLVTVTLRPSDLHGKAQPNHAPVQESLGLSYINTQDLLSMISAWNTSVISNVRTTSI